MKKILIVDDQKISLMMTSHILSEVYQTFCASSGDEAMKIYAKEKPDLILSDLHMPGMSGYELLKILQRQYNVKIPMMFMTADTSDQAESIGFETGAVDYIRKPFRADVLLKRVENILQNAEQIEGLKKAAETDPMTGLYNKASVGTEISRRIADVPGALMIMDIDSFKLVNDIYGHDMGDKLLIRFAEIVRSVVRAGDIIGRIGGDEFIAYCQNIKSSEVLESKTLYMNENLVSSAKELMGEDMNIPLGVSVGAVFAPDEGTDYEVLFKKADKALFGVKENGKHGFKLFVDTLRQQDSVKKENSDLAQAIKVMQERNQSKGAYSLSREDFKLIYRFLSRLTKNYQKEIWMVMFTLKEPQIEQEDIEEVSEAFREVLKNSLRQSDVITDSGKSQFIALLQETTEMDSRIVAERVRKNWEKTGRHNEYIVNYEIDLLE